MIFVELILYQLYCVMLFQFQANKNIQAWTLLEYWTIRDDLILINDFCRTNTLSIISVISKPKIWVILYEVV